MQNKSNMLIVVSGPDRVGKSTLIKQMQDELGNECIVLHHGPPPLDQQNIFDFYKEDIRNFVENPGAKYAIFDRAWPCSYILEQHRRRNAGHFEDLIDLELWINDVLDGAVVHLAQLRPWSWSAPLHVEELKLENPDAAQWYIRDQYISRMQEHKLYTEQLLSFYEDITCFPNVVLNETTSATTVLNLCGETIERSGT